MEETKTNKPNRMEHHEEIRYVKIDEQRYDFAGRFPIQHELNRLED